MGLKYDGTMLIKIPEDIKEEARKKAESRGKTLSEYVRNLIVTDIKGI
ncbi:MAG: hypothetical protein ACI4VQ_05765 [Clostridia bacterium]